MCCQDSLEDKAAKECKEYTQKHCPTPMVNNTRMDSMAYEPQTRTIHYYYSIYNEGDTQANADAHHDALPLYNHNLIQIVPSATLYN